MSKQIFVNLPVSDLQASKACFVKLGMEIEGETTVEGGHVDRLIGLQNVSATLVMIRSPNDQGRIELDKLHTLEAIRTESERPAVNELGLRRIMFAVDDLDSLVARLLSHGTVQNWSVSSCNTKMRID